MHVLQRAQREQFGQQGKGERRIIELAAQAQHREAEDIGMVEGERQRGAIGAAALRPDRRPRPAQGTAMVASISSGAAFSAAAKRSAGAARNRRC